MLFQVAEAYEVLSDPSARKEYDRTGVKQSDKNQNTYNNHNGNARRNGQPFWEFFNRRHETRHDPLQHNIYRRFDYRQQIHAAQRRVRLVLIDIFCSLNIKLELFNVD